MSKLLHSAALLLTSCTALAAYEISEADFAQRDLNGDGQISKSELPMKRLFRMLDSNRDGALTRAEVGLSEVDPDAPEGPPLVVAPAVVPANEAALIGHVIPNVSITDLSGTSTSLYELNTGKALAIILRDGFCPMAAKFSPAQARTAESFAQQGIPTLFVHIGDSIKDAHADLKDHKFKGTYVHDADGSIAAMLQAETTTEVYLLDTNHRLRYRGALSDQYGLRHALDAPRFPFLEQAAAALLEQREPAVVATSAPGCSLDLRPTATDGEITWHKDIRSIMHRNCVTCHHDGGPGPFSLETYEQVSGRRKGMIADVVDEGLMPPWFANPAHGTWANDRRLTDADRAAVTAWIDAGCPEGTPLDNAAALTIDHDWKIGEPDLVLRLPKPISIPAEGTVPYKNVMITNPLNEDRWVEAYEIRPGDPAVVHHILIFLGKEGITRDAGGLQGYFAGMVPGSNDVDYGPGFAIRLPAKAKLQFQLHYTTNGKATTDQSEIGFRFADKPPLHEIQIKSSATAQFAIPPGAPNYPVPATHRFTRDTVLTAFMPHMHTRGKAYRYELERPDGSREILLDIPEYDFNWQLRYRLAQPILVERGSILHGTGWYDNSKYNPANPDPTATVRHGKQTWDEMQIGYWEGYER